MNNTYIYIYTLYAYITFFKNCLVIVYVFIVCHSMCKICIRTYACIIVSGICRCIVSIVYIHVQTYNYSICIHKIPICMYVCYVSCNLYMHTQMGTSWYMEAAHAICKRLDRGVTWFSY